MGCKSCSESDDEREMMAKEEEEAEGRNERTERTERTERKERAERRERDEPEAKPVRETLCEAQDELRAALGELHLRAQRQDFEARLAASREIQEAEAEKAAADSEAYWAWMEGMQGAAQGGVDATAAFDRGHEYQRGLHERAMETQRRVMEAGRGYQESAQAAQEEFLDSLREIHQNHIAKLKAIWAALDPEAVDPQDLAAIAQLTSVAAQGLPATPGSGAPRQGG